MLEKLNVLDENGGQTDKIVSREDVHRLGLWHRCIHVWIINDKGEVLLQKRSSEKIIDPDKWSTATSGHLSAGDSSKKSAVREIGEEIGLKIKEDELQYLFTVKEKNEHKHKGEYYFNNEFTDVYLIKKSVKAESLKLQADEVSEVKWFPYKEFKNMVLEKDQSLASHEEMNMRMIDVLGIKD